MDDDTRAKRVYRIRLDLGDGWKTPMPMDAFAALLNKRGKTKLYDSSKVSRMESGERKVTIDDVPHISRVDPKRRGRDWLAWGMVVDEGQEFPGEAGESRKNG